MEANAERGDCGDTQLIICCAAVLSFFSLSFLLLLFFSRSALLFSSSLSRCPEARSSFRSRFRCLRCSLHFHFQIQADRHCAERYSLLQVDGSGTRTHRRRIRHQTSTQQRKYDTTTHSHTHAHRRREEHTRQYSSAVCLSVFVFD